MLFLHVSNCDTKIIIGPVGSHELSLQLVDLALVVFIHQKSGFESGNLSAHALNLDVLSCQVVVSRFSVSILRGPGRETGSNH